jgi:hypothetical protein
VRANAMKQMVELTARSGVMSKIAAKAVEAGIVVPSILKAELEKAGFKVKFEKAKKGSWCRISQGGTEAAMGFSDSDQDALLQALFARLREESMGHHTAKGAEV